MVTTDKEQYARSKAATARPLTLVRLAEICTNGRRKMVMSTITLLNTIYTRITELTGTLLNAVIVNNNSSFQNYTNPDDHTQQTTVNKFANYFSFVFFAADIVPACLLFF